MRPPVCRGALLAKMGVGWGVVVQELEKNFTIDAIDQHPSLPPLNEGAKNSAIVAAFCMTPRQPPKTTPTPMLMLCVFRIKPR